MHGQHAAVGPVEPGDDEDAVADRQPGGAGGKGGVEAQRGGRRPLVGLFRRGRRVRQGRLDPADRPHHQLAHAPMILPDAAIAAARRDRPGTAQDGPTPADGPTMADGGNVELRETSGLTVRLVVSYVRKVAGPEGVQELLRRAGQGRPLAVLEDEREWYSYAETIALFAAAAEVTGQPDVALRIGSHVFESAVGPSVRLMLSLFGSPAALLRHVAHANGKFTQCADLA